MNDSSYCRLCAHLRPNSDLITVIKNELTNNVNNLNLNYKIYHCFQIQIEINDKLPKCICSDCYDSVISTYDLIEKVQKAQQFLNNLFNHVENKEFKIDWESKSEQIDNDLRNLIKTEQFNDNDNNSSDYNAHNLKVDESSLDSDDVPLIKQFKPPSEKLRKNCYNSKENIYSDTKIESDANNLKEWKNYRWRCNLCSNVFEQSVNLLREHYESEHNKSPQYICNECNKIYVKFDLFKRHYRTHRISNKYKFKCEKCGKFSRNRTLHEKHVAKHTDSVSDPNENHTDWENYIWRCTVCSEEFHAKKLLVQHFKNEHNRAPEYFCMDCSKVYTKYILFKQHVRTHTNSCQFRCDTCGKLFHDKRILQKHCKFVHENAELSKYICSVCGKVFKWQTSFTYHKSHYHLPDEIKLQYECDICHKKVATEKSLATHKEIHEGLKKDHTCELCGLAFRQKGTLTAHIRHTHSNNKDNYRQCPLCLKVLKHETQLRRHTRNVHSTEKRFECETCGKKFYLRSKYTVHMRLHTGELPYACQYCQKRFRLKESLETHIRQHTGEKPYSCVDCNHDFTDFANYVKHMKRKHGVTSFKNVKKFSESNSLFKPNISFL